MALEILKSKAEIDRARQELHRRGLFFASTWWRRVAGRLGVARALDVGDELKSWDVLKTVDFLAATLPRSARILDIGAFHSPIPPFLHRLHYSQLAGVDLNPEIRKMPYAGVVQYEVADFLHSPFVDESFDAITAISVIEHGFNSRLLLTELSRLLKPGGYFVASFDYSPEKIDTTGISFFGMDWTIFSQDDVRAFLDEAKAYRLAPIGSIADATHTDKPIKYAQKEYTFAWLVLQKGVNNYSESEPIQRSKASLPMSHLEQTRENAF